MEQFSNPGKVLNNGNCNLSGKPVEKPYKLNKKKKKKSRVNTQITKNEKTNYTC